jgi:hypothetical protein
MNPLEHWLPLLPAAYAEIHYTLAGFSLIHRRWPEIIADAPYRVEPGRSIPLLLHLRHADRYPVTVESVRAVLRSPDGTTETTALLEGPIGVSVRSWHRLFRLHPSGTQSGNFAIDVEIDVRRPGASAVRTVVNRNLPGMKPFPLLVGVAVHPLPVAGGCLFADLHHHSEYTDDQVEYGAPLEAVAEIGPAMGLGAAAITDHSYDLDDVEDDFREKDPRLERWNEMRARCAEIGRRTGFALLPGEELSVSNGRGRNVHLLLLNQPAFVPGTGDSAEKWFRVKSERTVRETLDGLDPAAVAFAAHPEHRFHFLQRWLLARDSWIEADYRHPNLTGLEILNGPPDRGYLKGLRAWIRMLLEGRRLFIAAGNDAHGGFNRSFQLGLPWLSIVQSPHYRFGRSRTGILAGEKPDAEAVRTAIAAGRSFITTGPAMILEAENESGERARLGGTLAGNRFSVTVETATSPEFGPLEYVKLWLGDLAGRREVPWIELKPGDGEMRMKRTFAMENLKSDVYVRGLAVSRDASNRTSFCLTNPIWLIRKG